MENEEGLLDKFEKYKHGQKKAFIDWINSAKTEQTKANRIAKTITMIQRMKRFNSRNLIDRIRSTPDSYGNIT